MNDTNTDNNNNNNNNNDNNNDNIFSYLPQDILHQIFTRLTLQQILICRSVSKHLHTTLSSPPFTRQLPPFPLLALRPPSRHVTLLHLFDPTHLKWLVFHLSFLPFPSASPIASSQGLLYLWADNNNINNNNKLLVVTNPLTRQHKTLPQLGSAWSRHGSVLVDRFGNNNNNINNNNINININNNSNRVIVLNELAALYYCEKDNSWLKFSSNLPSKPRSPILVNDAVIALCDVGSPWRSQWKLFSCGIKSLKMSQPWESVERQEWGDVFDILKRPRLLKGFGNVVLMIGGLKSSFSLNASCSTILILKLDLGSLEWSEAGRMPLEMFRCFQESSKFKVFGGGNRVCFSAKRIGRLALWEGNVDGNGNGNRNGKEEWSWIDGVPGNGDGLYRGFLFDARLDASP